MEAENKTVQGSLTQTDRDSGTAPKLSPHSIKIQQHAQKLEHTQSSRDSLDDNPKNFWADWQFFILFMQFSC